MDRAENIKKYLDQEKEGKVAVVENVFIRYCQSPFLFLSDCFKYYLCLLFPLDWRPSPKAHFPLCFWLGEVDPFMLHFCSLVQKLFLHFGRLCREWGGRQTPSWGSDESYKDYRPLPAALRNSQIPLSLCVGPVSVNATEEYWVWILCLICIPLHNMTKVLKHLKKLLGRLWGFVVNQNISD